MRRKLLVEDCKVGGGVRGGRWQSEGGQLGWDTEKWSEPCEHPVQEHARQTGKLGVSG